MSSRAISPVSFQDQGRSMSPTKYIERRLIHAWKAISQRSRRRQRASVLPDDFVMLTSRRRSVRYT